MSVGFWHITYNPELTALEQWTFVQLTTLLSNHSCLTWVGPLVLVGLNHSLPARQVRGWWAGRGPLCATRPFSLCQTVLRAAGRGPKRSPENTRGGLRPGHGMHTPPPREGGFPGGSEGKESARNAGDPGSIPGSGRSPGEGNGIPLQYSCLENSMDGGAW